MRVRIEPAREAHARIIAPRMRERDAAEVRAGWGEADMELAILTALWGSRQAWTAFYELEPLAIYGVANLTMLGDSAQVWCFGTRAIDAHRLAFARASRQVLKELLAKVRCLTNYVAIDDEPALRWLEFLGAHYVLQPEVRNGRTFAQFVIAGSKGGACRQA